jgi:hypothetical protein
MPQALAFACAFNEPGDVRDVDPEQEEKGVLQLKYKMPYSDFTSLTDAERRRYTDKEEPMCVAHSLEDQIGGQLDAGFLLAGYFDDKHVEGDRLAEYMPSLCATRSLKPTAR